MAECPGGRWHGDGEDRDGSGTPGGTQCPAAAADPDARLQ
jgi:hypothetical protein